MGLWLKQGKLWILLVLMGLPLPLGFAENATSMQMRLERLNEEYLQKKNRLDAYEKTTQNNAITKRVSEILSAGVEYKDRYAQGLKFISGRLNSAQALLRQGNHEKELETSLNEIQMDLKNMDVIWNKFENETESGANMGIILTASGGALVSACNLVILGVGETLGISGAVGGHGSLFVLLDKVTQDSKKEILLKSTKLQEELKKETKTNTNSNTGTAVSDSSPSLDKNENEEYKNQLLRKLGKKPKEIHAQSRSLEELEKIAKKELDEKTDDLNIDWLRFSLDAEIAVNKKKVSAETYEGWLTHYDELIKNYQQQMNSQSSVNSTFGEKALKLASLVKKDLFPYLNLKSTDPSKPFLQESGNDEVMSAVLYDVLKKTLGSANHRLAFQVYNNEIRLVAVDGSQKPPQVLDLISEKPRLAAYGALYNPKILALSFLRKAEFIKKKNNGKYKEEDLLASQSLLVPEVVLNEQKTERKSRSDMPLSSSIYQWAKTDLKAPQEEEILKYESEEAKKREAVAVKPEINDEPKVFLKKDCTYRSMKELIQEAKALIRTGGETSIPFDSTSFMLEVEASDRKHSQNTYSHLQNKWEETLVKIENAIENETDEKKRILTAVNILIEAHLEKYRRNHSGVLRALQGKGTNCEGQTEMILGALQRLKLKPPKGFQFGIQFLPMHFQLVAYNPLTREVWNPLENSLKKGVDGPIFYPKILMYEILATYDRKPSKMLMDQLLMAMPNEDEVKKVLSKDDPRKGKFRRFLTMIKDGLFELFHREWGVFDRLLPRDMRPPKKLGNLLSDPIPLDATVRRNDIEKASAERDLGNIHTENFGKEATKNNFLDGAWRGVLSFRISEMREDLHSLSERFKLKEDYGQKFQDTYDKEFELFVNGGREDNSSFNYTGKQEEGDLHFFFTKVYGLYKLQKFNLYKDIKKILFNPESISLLKTLTSTPVDSIERLGNEIKKESFYSRANDLHKNNHCSYLASLMVHNSRDEKITYFLKKYSADCDTMDASYRVDFSYLDPVEKIKKSFPYMVDAESSRDRKNIATAFWNRRTDIESKEKVLKFLSENIELEKIAKPILEKPIPNSGGTSNLVHNGYPWEAYVEFDLSSYTDEIIAEVSQNIPKKYYELAENPRMFSVLTDEEIQSMKKITDLYDLCNADIFNPDLTDYPGLDKEKRKKELEPAQTRFRHHCKDNKDLRKMASVSLRLLQLFKEKPEQLLALLSTLNPRQIQFLFEDILGPDTLNAEMKNLFEKRKIVLAENARTQKKLEKQSEPPIQIEFTVSENADPILPQVPEEEKSRKAPSRSKPSTPKITLNPSQVAQFIFQEQITPTNPPQSQELFTPEVVRALVDHLKTQTLKMRMLAYVSSLTSQILKDKKISQKLSPELRAELMKFQEIGNIYTTKIKPGQEFSSSLVYTKMIHPHLGEGFVDSKRVFWGDKVTLVQGGEFCLKKHNLGEGECVMRQDSAEKFCTAMGARLPNVQDAMRLRQSFGGKDPIKYVTRSNDANYDSSQYTPQILPNMSDSNFDSGHYWLSSQDSNPGEGETFHGTNGIISTVDLKGTFSSVRCVFQMR